MLLLTAGVILFCLGRDYSKLFHTLGFTELRRLIFIKQFFQKGNPKSFLPLKKPPRSERNIALAESTNQVTTETNSQC